MAQPLQAMHAPTFYMPAGKIVLGEEEDKSMPPDLRLMPAGAKSHFWMVYELALGTLMVVSMGLLFTYVWSLSRHASFHTNLEVYDADTHAPARPFLLARDTTKDITPYMTRDGNVTRRAPLSGEGDRWQLPAEPSGLYRVAEMLSDARLMHNIFMYYVMVQSVAMCMVMVRLISHVMFQPRLAVLARTLAASMTDVGHYMVALLIWTLMFAMVSTSVASPCALSGACPAVGGFHCIDFHQSFASHGLRLLFDRRSTCWCLESWTTRCQTWAAPPCCCSASSLLR